MKNDNNPQDFNLDTRSVDLKHIPYKYIVDGYISTQGHDTQISREMLYLLLHGKITDFSEEEMIDLYMNSQSSLRLAATLDHSLVIKDSEDQVNALINTHFR